MAKELLKNAKFETGFGIGSFIFSTENRKMKPNEFLEKLKMFLNEQTSISNVKIDIITEILMGSGSFEKCFYKPIDYSPEFAFGDIEFILYLPEKNQKTLSIFGEYFDPLGNERFYVKIKYNNGLPVAFVMPIDITPEYDISNSVVIVREYFKQHIKNSKYIKFLDQGPSPAHLDIFIFINSELENRIAYKYNEMLEGYDKLEIVYNPNKISKNKLMDYIFDSLSKTFGRYYLWCAKKNYVMDRAYDFLDVYEKLIEMSKRIKFYKYVNLPKYIQESYLKLSEYEVNNIRLKNTVNDIITEIDKIEKLGRMPIAKEYIINELKEETEEFIESNETCYNTLSFLEGRYQNYSQAATILLSTIIGGLIGGILSILWK